jgi:hypothetical protein
MKQYSFEITLINHGHGYVTANNKQDAIDKLKSGNWDDILDEEMVEFEPIIDSIKLSDKEYK